jgi:pilus assembly protein Flp/PilA
MLPLITKAQSTWISLQFGARKLASARDGATAIEYGLIAAGIAVAIITAVNAIGTDLSSLFGRVSAKLNAAAPGG